MALVPWLEFSQGEMALLPGSYHHRLPSLRVDHKLHQLHTLTQHMEGGQRLVPKDGEESYLSCTTAGACRERQSEKDMPPPVPWGSINSFIIQGPSWEEGRRKILRRWRIGSDREFHSWHEKIQPPSPFTHPERGCSLASLFLPSIGSRASEQD